MAREAQKRPPEGREAFFALAGTPYAFGWPPWGRTVM